MTAQVSSETEIELYDHLCYRGSNPPVKNREQMSYRWTTVAIEMRGAHRVGKMFNINHLNVPFECPTHNIHVRIGPTHCEGKWERKQGLQCQSGSASGLCPQSIAVYHCIRGLV